MTFTKKQKKNINRGITVGLIGAFVAAFVSLNANTFLLSSGLYIGMTALSIFLFLVWDKI